MIDKKSFWCYNYIVNSMATHTLGAVRRNPDGLFQKE